MGQANQEDERIARLRELMVLDSAPEPVFDSIVTLASEVCGAPIALVSLVDTERQWFKANVGLPGVNETPRDVAFCSHAIGQDALFEVSDATRDARFRDNPLVTGQPDIRFYAGAPLVLPGGERVGTLCVIDRQPRALTPEQKHVLHALARIATEALLSRRDLIARATAVRSDYEAALADSEARYRAMVEQQAELVSLARPDGELVFANDAYARHFGLTPAQMIGKSLYEFVELRDRADVERLLARVLDSGQAHTGENRMLAADGSERWVAWTNRLQHDAQGKVLLHSVGRDVTDRRRAELALRASQAALARTGRIAGVGGWQLDLLTNTLEWSEQTRLIHEVGPDFVPSLENAVEFYAPQAREQVASVVRKALEDGTPWDLELPLVTARGRDIWVRAQGEVEFDGEVPVRIAGAFQDISERRRLTQALEDKERFVRQVTDALPVRIAYMDRALRFQFVNQAHCDRFGRPREQVQGHTLNELTGRANDAQLLARVQDVLDGTDQHFEYDEVDGAGTRRFEVRLIPDVDGNGQVQGFYSIGIDITQRSATERALRERTAIIENTTDFVVQTDARGQLTYLNPAARVLLGIAADGAIDGLNFRTFNTDETNRNFSEVILPIVHRDGVWAGESTCYDAQRNVVPMSQIVIAHRDDQGQVTRYSAVMRDISVQQRARAQMARQAATLRSVTEAIPASVAVVGRDLRYRFVNPAFERWVDSTRDQIVGSTIAEVVGAQEYERNRSWVERVLAGEPVRFERSYEIRGDASHIAVDYIPLWIEDGSVDGYVAVLQDISHHKLEEVRLLQLAQRDALTGLLNRAGFEQQIEQAVAAGNGSGLALLYVDLDHFKPVNDRYGHPAGDEVLQLFAQRLSALVRSSDVVARLGGDEFAILLVGVREASLARRLADKVIAAAQAPFTVAGHVMRIGASVGLAFGVPAEADWTDLVARADAMLYEAKNAGRGRQAGATG
ncbi:MAG: PAS domain S-box protein [Burkholderiaceae bacterium]